VGVGSEGGGKCPLKGSWASSGMWKPVNARVKKDVYLGLKMYPWSVHILLAKAPTKQNKTKQNKTKPVSKAGKGVKKPTVRGIPESS